MSYDIFVDLIQGTPYSSATAPDGGSTEPYKYLYDIKLASDGAVIQSDDDVNVNLIYNSTWQETLHIPFTVDSGKLFTVFTSDSTNGQATITGAEPVGGFKLPASLGSTELLTDGGVEEWTGATLDNWTHYGAGVSGTIEKETTTVQHGNSSVKLTRTAANPYGIYQSSIPLTDSTTYRLSFINYNQDATIVPSVYIVRGSTPLVGDYLQTNGTWAGAIPVGGVPMSTVTSTAQWTKSVLDFTTGVGDPDVYTVMLSTYVTTGKYVIFDSISLRELEETDGFWTNGSGNFDSPIILNNDLEDWGGGDPDDWTVVSTPAAGATHAEEVGTVYFGSSALKVTPAAAGTKIFYQDITLETSTTYKISVAHMEQLNDKAHYSALGLAGVGIIKGAYAGVGDTYWDGTAWDTAPLSIYWLYMPQRQYWTVDEFTFTTDSSETTYSIVLAAAFTVAGVPFYSQYYDYYFDLVTIGRADEDTDDNSHDPQMLAWDVDNTLVHYTHIDKTNDNVPWATGSYSNSEVSQGDIPRFYGIGKGTRLYHWNDEDVGIYQTYSLTTGRSYRAQVFSNIHNTYTVSNNPLYMMIVKEIDSTPRYWNSSTNAFQTSAVNAATLTCSSWDIMSVDFTADGTTDYAVVVHSGEMGSNIKFDGYEIFIDELSLIQTVTSTGAPYDDEYYHTFFDWPNDRDTTDYDTWCPVGSGAPYQVYVTGTLRQLDVEGYQLHKEAVFTDQPRRMCWSYDEPNRMMYINVGEDPTDLTIEAVVRDRTVNTGTNATPSVGNSRVTISDLALQKSGLDCVRIREHTATRQTDVTIEICNIEDAGTASIASGYRDASDYTNNQLLYLTCSDTTIDQCKCYRGNAASVTNRAAYGGDYSGSSTVQYWTENDIDIAAGTDWTNIAGDDAGDQTISKCHVEGIRPLVNANFYNNGIAVATGDYVYVHDSSVTRTNHGIVITGYFSDPATSSVAYADARYVEVKGCYSYETGDDNCWLAGINDTTNGNSKVCFNIFAWSNDNNLEMQSCVGVEVYNNVFHRAFNQQIGIYNDASFAFIFNNIFDYWNEYYAGDGIHGAHVGGAGSAIGFVSSTYYASNFIDNNIYFDDPSKTMAKSHVFNVDGTTYTSTEWINSLNYDRRSLFWSDPKFIDRSELNFRLKHDSPAIDRGLVLANLREQIGFTGIGFMQFDNLTNYNSLIDPDSSWPDAVQFIDGDAIGDENTMEVGPFAYATVKTIYTVVDAAYAPIEDLSGEIITYKTAAGEDVTPVPTIYELGNGMYGFATRITQPMSIRIDVDSENAEGLTDDLRYQYTTINPDAEYLKILTESYEDVGEIYQNVIDIKSDTTSLTSDTEELLGLVFKNSVRDNRQWSLIEGEQRLISETVTTYSNSNLSTALHTYSITYTYSGERVSTMTVKKTS